jgi:hypothetical protein
MTVSSTAAKIQHNGDGSTSAFSVPFSYTSEADIVVVVTSAAGVDSTKTNGVQYELSNPGDTGTVTFGVSPVDYRPQTGEKVTITRVISIVQQDDYVNGAGFNSAIIEAALDRITRIEQMLAERISRAPKLRATTPTGELTFPEPSASAYVGWNSAGTDLMNVAASVASASVSPFMASVLDDANAAAALTTLGAQPLDSDLTAIAALTTTSYGRSLLTLANVAALVAEVDASFLTPAEGNAAYQPLDSDLTAIAALTTTAYGRALLALADAAALTALGNTFTSALKGLVPASGGGTTTFLRADGTFAAPTSSALTYVESGTVSAAATKDFTIPANCDEMEIKLWGWRPANDTVSLFLRFSQAAAFLAGAADYKWGGTIAAAAASDSSDSEIELATSVGGNAGEIGHFKINISRPLAAATVKSMTWIGAYNNNIPNYVSTQGGGELLANTNVIDGVRLLYSAGNIAEGFYTVRAYRNV